MRLIKNNIMSILPHMTSNHHNEITLSGFRSVRAVMRGGLGNQMFQYAAARALATDCSSELSIDITTGFKRDRVYRRNYLLDSIGVSESTLSAAARIPLTLRSIEKKFHLWPEKSLVKRSYGCFLEETSDLTPAQLQLMKLPHSFFMDGYWQNEAYFSVHATAIAKTFLSGLDKIKPDFFPKPDDIAIGLRLYEEVSESDSKFHRGRDATLQTLRNHISDIRLKRSDQRFYIFSTMSSADLISLDFPDNCVYITPDHGYIDPVSSLRLLSHFKYHLITPSTYYWWGAWLSQKRHPKSGSIGIAGDFGRLKIPYDWNKISNLKND